MVLAKKTISTPNQSPKIAPPISVNTAAPGGKARHRNINKAIEHYRFNGFADKIR